MLLTKNFFKKRVSGVSLLELLVVIALMAGFLGFAIPSLFRGLENELEKRVRILADYVDNLRFLSILQNKPFKLVFDFENKEIYVESKIDGLWQRTDEFEAIVFDQDIRLDYFKENEKDDRKIDVLQSRINVLPFGYIKPFEVVISDKNRGLYFKITTVLGESETGEIGTFSH